MRTFSTRTFDNPSGMPKSVYDNPNIRGVSTVANPEYYAQRGIPDPRNPMAQLPPPQTNTQKRTRSKRSRRSSTSSNYQPPTQAQQVEFVDTLKGRQGLQPSLGGLSRIVTGKDGKPTFERKTQLNDYGYGTDPFAHMRV